MTDEEIKAILASTPDELACIDELIRLRWPTGIRCACGGREIGRVATRPRVVQCRKCGRQRSVTSGTSLEGQKVPIRICFAAARCLCNPTGVAAAAFARVTGKRYETIWRLFHRLRLALDDESPFIRSVVRFEVSRVYVGTQADGFDPSSRAGRTLFDETALVGKDAGHAGKAIRIARVTSELGALMHDREVERPCPKCAPKQKPGETASVARLLDFTLSHVHGGVGKRWFDAYLREHEFRANRRGHPELARAILRRQLLREPRSFVQMRCDVTPRRGPDAPALPPLATPSLPRRDAGTAPRWLPVRTRGLGAPA